MISLMVTQVFYLSGRIPAKLPKGTMKRLIIIAFAAAIIIGNTWPAPAYADTNPHVGLFSPERTWAAAANANLNLRQPDPRPDDLMLAMIAVRPSTATFATPSGWTLVDNRVGTDSGAEGADTGSVRKYVFSKQATGSEGVANQTFVKSGTVSVSNGTIIKVRSATGTYDVAAGGYSINGDATTWGGTLDTDIGLTAGDLVVMSTAVNGDLSAASGQALSAPGITGLSTVYEHGEFTSTTGNDIEQTMSSALVRAGTSTGAPTLVHTKSVAVSGAMTAVRVRQGAGVNRTDTWVRSAGSQVTGTTSSAARYPEHEVGDLLVLFVGNRYDTSTPTTPSGWTYLGSYTGGAGTNGADAGTGRISAYYMEVTALKNGTQAVSVPSGNSTVTQMIALHKDDVFDWRLGVDGGSDNTADTAWSITGNGMKLSSALGGDIILAGSTINTDLRTFSNYTMSSPGITFGEVTETAEFRSTSGNDMALTVSTGRVDSGSSTSSPLSFAASASGSTASAPAGASAFVRVIGLSTPTGTLATDMVDASGDPIANPNVAFPATYSQTICTTNSTPLVTSGRLIRVSNQTPNSNWTLSLAPTSGPGALWQSGGHSYDFNDSALGGCGDGADLDGSGGQLGVDLVSWSITPEQECSGTGISAGSSMNFSEGSVDAITLATASSGAMAACYWDVNGVNLTQKLPALVAPGDYHLDMTLTATAF